MKLKFDRISVLFYFIAVAFAVLIIRLFQIQVLDYKKFSRKLESQTERRIVLQPLRGMILDRNGSILAQATHRRAAVVVDGQDRVLKLNRIYPYGNSASQLIGYTGSNKNGLGGVEYSCNDYLSGEPGWKLKKVDGKKRTYDGVGNGGEPAVDGEDVYLTIDIEIQKIVEQVLRKTLDTTGAKNATAIVLDPNNGDVLAMATLPDYNNNYWWLSEGEHRKNRATNYMYEPGSTMKVVTLSRALDLGYYKVDDSIDGMNGAFKIYNEVIRDHHPRGMMSIQDALAYSSNVSFAQIGDSLGKENMYKAFRDFGFGTKTGIAVNGEARGQLNPLENWSGRTAATVAFGHEMLATLLQVSNAFATVANGGFLLKPHVVKKIVDSNGKVVKENDRTVIRSVIKPEVAKEVREIMTSVVDYGTAKNIKKMLPVKIAAKTGTSEKIDKETGHYMKDVVWASFVAIAPYDNPAVVIAVMVDEPTEEYSYGSKAAAPAVAQILNRIVSTPNLPIAQRILKETDSGQVDIEDKKVKCPSFVDLSRKEAIRICKSKHLNYEFVGDGELITHQSPAPKTTVINKTPILLYTNKIIEKDSEEENIIIMPSCVGRTMKDGINALSIKGITPKIVGVGKIVGQKPTAGTVITALEPCTLYCETKVDNDIK